jgi:hypothetical protein
VRDALKGADVEAIKQATEQLTTSIYEISTELYAKTAEKAEEKAPAEESDYEVVDEK